jgi:hypothetical protein
MRYLGFMVARGSTFKKLKDIIDAFTQIIDIKN